MPTADGLELRSRGQHDRYIRPARASGGGGTLPRAGLAQPLLNRTDGSNFEQLSGGRTDTAPDLAKHHTETDHWQETSPAANLAATDVPRSVHTTCELGFYAVAGDGFEPS
jgi:hypothetical protein